MSDLRLIHGKANSAAQSEKIAGDGPPTRVLSKEEPITASSFEPGNTVGSYLIVSKIGEGGMGMVYKAHDTTLDRTVALKVLSPHLFRNPEFMQRFRIEAQAQARLNGPNIVTLHSMFEIPGSLVLVMEYVEGHTLDQRMHNEGRLSVASTVWVFEQALLGVERAHRMGIVHRDLKPSNIYITTTHEVKLMDFGVAKILDNKANTQSGSMIGTLMYISPEQIKGQDADFRSDIYTLGITLYQAVTGVLPYEKKTDYEYMNAHLHEQPLPPTALQPAIPQELEDIILKSIDKDPDKRFQNAHEFRRALLKVGMVHVRAYRRLKAIRKEKDRAALSASPTYRREREEEVMVSIQSKWQDWLELLSERKALLLPAATVVGVLGIAMTLWLRPSSPVATPTVLQDAPAIAVETTAPAQPQPSLANSSGPASISATGPITGASPTSTPGTVKATAVADPTSQAVPANKIVSPKPRPAPRKQVVNTEAPKKNPDDQKYDALKQAWGG